MKLKCCQPLDSHLSQSMETSNVTLDLETGGLNPLTDPIHLVVYRYSGENEIKAVSLEEAKRDSKLIASLGSSTCVLRGHNIKFDASFLVASGIPVLCRLEDTRVQAYLNWPNDEHGLKSLTEKRLKRKVVRLEDFAVTPKKKHINAFRNSDKYVEIGGSFFLKTTLRKYAIADVVNCDSIKLLMTSTPWWREVEMPLTTALFKMEQRGIYLDTAKLKELKEDFTLKRDKLQSSLGEINPNSGKQLAEKLKNEGLDLKKVEKTEKGAPKLDKMFFKRRAWEGDEFASNLLEYRKYNKNLNTYVEPLLEYALKDGRVHGSFNQAGSEDFWGDGAGGTSTGRLTASNPNLQNIPARTAVGKAVRSCFIPTPGYSMFDADLKQIEPRVVAHFTQAPKLLTAYQEGLDTHGMFASDIFHKPVDKLSKVERFIGKTSWLATVYGCSFKKLLLICEVNSDEPLTLDLEPYMGLWDKLHPVDKRHTLKYNPLCDQETYAKWMFFKNVQDQFKKANPEIMSWRSFHITRTKQRGYVETLGGRRISVPGILSNNKREVAKAERHCVNYLIQGSAADIMKKIIVRFQTDFVDKGYGHLLATVHDEILGEIPSTSYLEGLMGNVKDIMCNTVKLKNVPIDTDANIIPNWGSK